MKEFLNTLKTREYFQDCTDAEGLTEKLGKGEVKSAYIGFDCTADSLHVGSLMQIMILRKLQQAGIKPIILLGGGTSLVGDPSGKDETRKLITEEIIANNMAGIKSVFEKFLQFGEGDTDALIVNNADWLGGLKYIEFLRDVGRHFSVNRMMQMESVKLRLEREQHLSFLEFNYMILQGYDFVELNNRYGTNVQIGGSDQWGNIIQGIELQRRISEGKAENLYGITTPLLTTSSGAKMGKTADGAIWLNEDRLSAYDYWQFWRNTEDADVIKFIKLFTELSDAEIAELEKLEGADINKAKIILANEATKLAHGAEAATSAEVTAQKVFEHGGVGDLPSFNAPAGENAVADLLVISGLEKSKGAARRLIKGGGVRINDEKVVDEFATHFLDNQIKLSAGKKRHVLINVA